MTTQVFPSLSDFEGLWHIDRRIADTKAGQTGHFEGTATFSSAADGVAYHEVGLLHMPHHAPFHAERRYHWREVGRQLQIFFDDGRFFHGFSPTEPKATHWCDPDTYDVSYVFDDWPNWQSTWTVNGPRKAYQMVSHYSRLKT